MATFLFNDIIFGPIISRRLGSSLGINLLPKECKFCNFDCIYCECGWTPELKNAAIDIPSKEVVTKALEIELEKLSKQNQQPDVITFAGNGEPTLHPDFADIVISTIEIRNRLSPFSKVAVLSNATMLHKKEVYNALSLVDENIQKLDAAENHLTNMINKPLGFFNLNSIIHNLKKFNGNVIIQSLFLKAVINNEEVDNTAERHLEIWLNALEEIKPGKVLLYTYSRDTPHKKLWKTDNGKLQEIANKVKSLGISAEVF